ncbi:MAG: hypothetical protein H5T74_04080 [Actinobacteria bacterium]|nr:hypothetical protein [Actinomycetota bacterium]
MMRPGKKACRTACVVLLLLLGASSPAVFRTPESAQGGVDGGWSVQFQDDAASIFGVSAVDGNTCWAVGRTTGETPRALALRTTDGGDSWTPSYPGFPTILTCASAVSEEVCWAGGYGCIVKTADGGSSWEVSIAADGYCVTDISAVDGSTCWAVGYSTSSGTAFNGFIIKTDDGGGTWEVQAAGIPCTMTGVSAVDGQTCWASGGFFSPGMTWPPVPPTVAGRLMKTSDGGSHWQDHTVEGYAYFKVSAPHALDVWVAALHADLSAPSNSRTEILRSADGGVSWDIHPTPVGYWSYGNGGFCAVDGCTAFLAVCAQGWGNHIARSDDGGASWNIQADGLYVLSDISTPDGTAAWACGCDPTNLGQYGHGYIMHTSSGGWEPSLRIDGISPSSGYNRCILEADLHCTGFDEGFSVRMEKDGSSIEVAAWPDADDRVHCVLDLIQAEPGVYDVVLANPDGGEARLPAGFTVLQNPVCVDTADPASGMQGTAVSVRVTGSGFSTDMKVSLMEVSGGYGLAASSTAVVSPSLIVCTFELYDVREGEYHLAVSDASGNLSLLPGGFSVLPNPDPVHLNGIAPDRVTQFAGFVSLELKGSGFKPGATVRLRKGGALLEAAGVSVSSPQRITCSLLVFGAEPGAYDVVVVNPDGTGARMREGFRVEAACGQGSGSAALLFGAFMGLLSAAASARSRRKRSRRP